MRTTETVRQTSLSHESEQIRTTKFPCQNQSILNTEPLKTRPLETDTSLSYKLKSTFTVQAPSIQLQVPMTSTSFFLNGNCHREWLQRFPSAFPPCPPSSRCSCCRSRGGCPHGNYYTHSLSGSPRRLVCLAPALRGSSRSSLSLLFLSILLFLTRK